ncbi:MAG TPA: membrane dipeptidase [Kofleriaceae bacterium]|nr:membrane dipeptidase [Kofleriaceae bacterium]
MFHRRDILIGAGATALAACMPAARPLAGPPPSHWPRYRDAMAIDGAGGLFLIYPDDMAADDVAREVAAQIAHARASGLTAVVMTVGPSGRFWLTDAAFEKTKRDLATWKAKIAEHPDALVLVDHAADLDTAHRERRLGIVFTFQGTEPLGEDADRISLFRELGVRVIQLTHNRRNLVGDGSLEPGNAGLSNFGHEVIERLNAAKIVVDLAHGAQRTIRDGIAACKAPMLISHTGCRALADLPRNVGDAELRALADRGGVAGIIFWPYLRTDTQPMAIDVIRHIEHAIDVAGEDHVGLGTDAPIAPTERTPEFEKQNREMIADMVQQGIFAKGRPPDLYTFIPDLNVTNRFEVLAALLAARGHSDARIAKVLGGNFARVMREVWG